MDMVPASGSYRALPGGSPYNVALAVARLGGEVAFVGKFSHDAFGQVLSQHLAESGVEMKWACATPLLSSLAFASLDAEGRASYALYLERTAGCSLTVEDLAQLDGLEPTAIHLSSFSLFTEPVASAIDALREQSGEEVLLSVVPNIRAFLIEDDEGVRERLQMVMAESHLLKCSDEDLGWLNPSATPESFCEEWLAKGPLLVAVTLGEEGAVLAGKAGLVRVPVPEVVIRDTIGAGDTFQAALLVWLQQRKKLSPCAVAELSRVELQEMGRFASLAAALNCTQEGCDPPRLTEMAGV